MGCLMTHFPSYMRKKKKKKLLMELVCGHKRGFKQRICIIGNAKYTANHGGFNNSADVRIQYV